MTNDEIRMMNVGRKRIPFVIRVSSFGHSTVRFSLTVGRSASKRLGVGFLYQRRAPTFSNEAAALSPFRPLEHGTGPRGGPAIFFSFNLFGGASQAESLTY